MKTIQEMWEEFCKSNAPLIGYYTTEEIKCMRRIFFAGFNRCYNVMSQSLVYYIPQYESEMDAHSEDIK